MIFQIEHTVEKEEQDKSVEQGEGEPMGDTCKLCKHFRLHYIKGRHRHGAYEPLHYGHCVYPRRKRREADTPACEHFCARAICKVKRRQA